MAAPRVYREGLTVRILYFDLDSLRPDHLGCYGYHMTADGSTCHVPLIVRLPGGAAGRVDYGLRYHLDLAPTLADLHGQEPLAVWDGRSFAGALRGAAAAGWDELILSTCAGACQRSVRFDRWLYVRTDHDGYNPFPPELLFDLAVDPHEEQDRAAERPAICREAAYRLTNCRDRMMRTMPPGAADDPLWTVIREGGPSHVRGKLPAYLALLRRTGHADAALELARRHPTDVQ